MAHEFIELGGGRHASVGKDFKEKIRELIRKHFDNAQTGQSQQEIEQELSQHPYLSWDEWGSAMHQAALKRYNDCKQILGELSPRLDTLSLMGLEGTTGHAALTSDKLKGRPVRVLDVAPDWLLIEVPRHPTGGSGRLKVQYWLYKRGASSIELLRPVENVVNIPFDSPLRQDENGVWNTASEERDSFYELVETRLGAHALERIKKITNFQLILLSTPPDVILDQCEARTGYDYRIEEAKQSKETTARYTKKFGPRSLKPAGVSLNITRGAALHVLDANHFLKQLAQEVSDYIVTNYSSLGFAAASEVTVELKLKESPQCFEVRLCDSQSRVGVSMAGYSMQISDVVNTPESATLDVQRRGSSDDFDLAVIMSDQQRCDVPAFVTKLITKLRGADSPS